MRITNSSAHILTLWLYLFTAVAEAAHYEQCLKDTLIKVHNHTINWTTYPGDFALDSSGRNVSNPQDATAIPYGLCIQECGSGPESFDWEIFSTNLSTWLLPWLALVSQLPFGSQLRQQNLMSIFLTLGSPALAGYSLIVCVLNWAWVPSAFEGIQYPNIEHAWQVLGSLQHSPLHIDLSQGMLAGLVGLPENDQWWQSLAQGLNYEETWTTAIILQTAWVVIAFILTVVDSFQGKFTEDVESSGRGIGTLFLWLLPLVIGWQRLSPRCDYARVRDALQRANEKVYCVPPQVQDVLNTPHRSSELVAFSSPQTINNDLNMSPPAPRTFQPIAPMPAPRQCTNRFPFALMHCEDDRGASAPIYSDTRLLPWSASVELVSRAFRIAAEVMAAHDVDPKDEHARRILLSEVNRRIQRRRNPLDWNTIIRRCATAGALAMILHWGAIGSTILYSWYTFTSGLGCRAGAFTLYAVIGTVVWLIIVSSSFIIHYAQWLEYEQRLAPRLGLPRYHLSPRYARRLAKVLRVVGKLLAIANTIFIVTACISLFSNFFTRCWCDTSVLSRKAHAFTLIAPTDADQTQLKNAWIGAIVLSMFGVLSFIGFVYLHVQPVSPDPNSLLQRESDAYKEEGYVLAPRAAPEAQRLVHDYGPYSPDIIAHSPEPEGYRSTPSNSSHAPLL